MAKYHYTRGEVHSLVGPIMDIDPEYLETVVIIGITKDGDLKMKGPAETPTIMGGIVEHLFANAWNPRETGWEDDDANL